MSTIVPHLLEHVQFPIESDRGNKKVMPGGGILSNAELSIESDRENRKK